MYKHLSLTLIVLLSIPGCWQRKMEKTRDTDLLSEVDIPVAGDTIRSFFDDDIDAFAFAQDNEKEEVLNSLDRVNEYAWVEDDNDETNMKVIYFDFDRFGIKDTQEENVIYDIKELKQIVSQSGEHQTVVVEGHACHSAGSAAYNLAISEKRAKSVADRLIASGVPSNRIKIVGRGQEVPAVMSGHKVTGDRQDQWANRRAEIHLIEA